MNLYKVRQVGVHGEVLSEKYVEADDYAAALRQLHTAAEGAKRIEVYNKDGETAGQINVDYWRSKVRRR